MVVSQIKDEIDCHLQTRDSEVLAILQSILALVSSSSLSSEETQSYDQQANTLIDRIQLEILKLLKELMVELSKLN